MQILHYMYLYARSPLAEQERTGIWQREQCFAFVFGNKLFSPRRTSLATAKKRNQEGTKETSRDRPQNLQCGLETRGQRTSSLSTAHTREPPFNPCRRALARVWLSLFRILLLCIACSHCLFALLLCIASPFCSCATILGSGSESLWLCRHYRNHSLWHHSSVLCPAQFGQDTTVHLYPASSALSNTILRHTYTALQHRRTSAHSLRPRREDAP